MKYIFFNFIIVIIVICIFPIRWFIIYKKNKSSLNTDLNNYENSNETINIELNKKYEKLQAKHDEVYKNSKKEILLVPVVIATFVCFILTYVNWYFILGVPIMIGFVALFAASGNNANKKKELNKEYENIIFSDIIIPLLDVKKINQVDISENMSYEEVELIEIYNEKQEQIIQNIMKTMGKKNYNRFSIIYDLDCQMKNYWLNIKKISNSLKINHEANTSINSNYIYFFVGYFITIPNFYNIEKLNKLSKRDYYYDNNKNTLFLLISEEITSDIIYFSLGKNKVEYNKSFNEENILLRNYNFFKALKNYIMSIIE